MNRKFWHGLAFGAALVVGYKWGLHVQADKDQAVMDQHLSDDSIDNETVLEICTPRAPSDQEAGNE